MESDFATKCLAHHFQRWTLRAIRVVCQDNYSLKKNWSAAHPKPIQCACARIAGVSAVSLSFQAEIEQASEKAGERRSSPEVSNKKNGKKWVGGGEKSNRLFLRSPHPLPLLLIFRTPSQFRSLRVSFWKRLLRRLVHEHDNRTV